MLDTTRAITFEHLPGAYFFSDAAVQEATRYENAVAAHQANGDEAALWDDLAALGYDRDEIEWHVRNRGKRMAQGYT
jgi:hypothetical protein